MTNPEMITRDKSLADRHGKTFADVLSDAVAPFDGALDSFNDAARAIGGLVRMIMLRGRSDLPLRSVRERCAEVAIAAAPTPHPLGTTHGLRGSP